MKDEEPNKIIELESTPTKDINLPLDLEEPKEEIKETKVKKKEKLITLNSQIQDKSMPHLSLLEDQLQMDEDDEDLNDLKITYVYSDKKDIMLSKYLYISKDFIFMLILLISSGLNFSYLYFPFFLVVFFSYFLLFRSGKNAKLFKRILEICSLVYAVGILALKIFFCVSVRKGKDFGENKQFMINLGILNLIDKDSNYFFVASFIGECFVIMFCIYCLIISYLSKTIDVSEYVDPDNEIKLNEFYALMSRCIYLFYISVVGWSIFNRSILTLIYIMPMNVILYILSMKYRKNILFYIFKFFSMIMSVVIFIHLLLINVFNIASIRDQYITDDLEIRDGYPRVVNAWTKLGINQAFHKDMKGNKLAEEFSGYFFGVVALLVLVYTNKKLTFNKSKLVLGKKREELENEDYEIDDTDAVEEIYLNFWQKLLRNIKKIIYNSSFILHICRISAILWLYYYQNFYSIGVIIWLLFSFLYLRVTSNKIVTIVFLAPMVFVCLFCYHLANIDGFIENKDNQKIYRNFALGKFSHKNVEYILCNIFFFLITFFIYTIFRKTIKKEAKKEIKEDKKDKMKTGLIQKKEEENEEKEEKEENIIKTDDKEDEDDLDQFIKKSKETEEFLKDEEKEVKEEEIEELYNNLTLMNIIKKAIASNIDKITLIFLYFLAVNSINIVHFLIVIIFLMQLLFPELTMNYSIIFIIFSQVIFLIEYCFDLFKNADYSENSINLIKLFIPFDLNEKSIDFLLYAMAYCYYEQNQLYYSEFFKKIGYDNNISLNIYIKVIFHKYPKLQKALYIIGNIIMEIYAWVLIVIFMVFNGIIEISIFFAINLLLFLCILYTFLKNIKNQKNGEINLLLNKILMILCALNVITVFIFQIICLDIFDLNESLETSNNFFIKNLPAFGFYRYFNNRLSLKFLPHFINNFIVRLFVTEMRNLLTRSKEKENIRIEDSFKKKKYELLIEHKISLDKKKEEIQEGKNKRKRKESDLSLEINLTKEKSKEISKIKSKEIPLLEKKSSQSSVFQRTESEDIDSERNALLEEYNANKSKMTALYCKYLLYNMLLILTKFYWIFLFLFMCIIFTTYDISILLFIYIIIFGIIFMRMFYLIISRLSAFNDTTVSSNNNANNNNNINNNNQGNKKEYRPFFISKLIRYNLIERTRHINDNRKYRSLGFKYLILFNFFSYFLVYLDGVYNIFQGGCRTKVYNDCDKNHLQLVGEQGVFSNISEDVITSISYLFGFDVNLNNETVLLAGWIHITLGALLCFDAYVQIFEEWILKLTKANKREYRHLANINIMLKPKVYGQKNVLGNIQTQINAIKEKGENEEDEEEEITVKKVEKPKLLHAGTIEIDINAQADQSAGEELIAKFKTIFVNAAKKKVVKLSSSNGATKLIIMIKKLYEEIIIFFLICSAVAKLNIWSIIYIIYSTYLILSRKTMKKYYILYCFIISSIIVQISIFISNLQKSTDPNADSDIEIMDRTFSIPWYKNYEIKDEMAFFFGLGVCRSQINLIWMDFIEVIIIYIYLEYFSYSIYQEGKTIGKSESSINYFNLHLNGEVRKVTEKLSEEEFKKHRDCLEYNFGVRIDKEFEDFKYYIEKGKAKDPNQVEEKKEEEKIEEKKEEEEKEKSVPVWMKKMKTKEDKKENKTNIANLKSKEISGNSCMSVFKKFLYLSFHNLILILIITFSMMISGFISVVYIIISLYFLLTSTRIYLGKHYYYPRAIKKLLRIMILVDILLQIIYQIPFVDTKKESDTEDESTFYKILGYIGLNKILVFKTDSQGNFDVIIEEEIALVIAKTFLYFLMSLQILIYSSRNFIEYYLAYIITKNSYLRRVSLMNVFKFNNKRVEVMDKAIALRQDMTKKLEDLEKTLVIWNQNIMKKNQELAQEEIEEDEEINNEEININNTPEDNDEENADKIAESISKTSLGLGSFLKMGAKTRSAEHKKDEKEKTPSGRRNPLSQSIIPKDVNVLQITQERCLTEKEVIDKVKEWVLSGFLIRLQMRLHRKVANYNNISEKEKYIYEREIIEGKSQVSTLIESLIETELRTIELTDFTESEMKELKQYFDGTRKKKLQELMKKREKMMKLQRSAKKAAELNKLVKIKEPTEEEKKKAKEEREKMLKQRQEEREKRKKEREANKRRVNIRAPKFKNIRQIAGNNVFAKYLTKSYIIKSILNDILSFFSNNFKWGCYFIMVLNHIMSSSLLSLFYPISIFCYAIMEYPRPKKIYWSICFIYTIICLVLKFIIQLNIFRQIKDYDKKIKTLENYLIGLKLCESTFSKDFFIYILLDALVLIFLLINNYLLVFSGLYDKREQEIESIYQANERIAKTQGNVFKFVEDVKKFNEEYLSKEERKFDIDENQRMEVNFEEKKEEISNENKKINFFKRIKKEKSEKERKKEEEKRRNLFNESNRTYYQALFPEARNEKPGNEYYVSYTIAMTLIIIYLFIFYTIMIKDKTFGPVSLDTKQFSGEMVRFLLFHIAFLVADRIVYIRQNRTNLQYQYILYDKNNKTFVKNLNEVNLIKTFPLFKKTDTIIPLDYEERLKKQYKIIYIQREEDNKPLIAKYIMQMILVIFGHIFVFFFMPMYGNYKLNSAVYCKEENKECNDFLKNISLPIFYIFYLVYFVCSGQQIKYGFYDMKRKSVLKAKSDSLHGGIYAGYKAIPFLYELKLGIDWTFTTTCLDIFQWNKFESVYDVIYTTNCAMTGVNKKKVGQSVKKGSKIGMGGGISFFLLLVLVGPLLLFSTLNPTNELNNLTNADLTVELSFIYKNELMKNYTIYHNSKPESIGPISSEDFTYYKYNESVDTKNFPKEQIETVIFSEDNDNNWDLTLPHIKNLIELIQNRNKTINESDENYIVRIDLIMDYTFYRALPPEGQEAHKRYNSTIYERGEKNDEDENLSLLGNALKECHDVNVIYKKKYYPPIRLRASSHPKSMVKKEYFTLLDVQLGFVGCQMKNESNQIVPSYLESYFTFSTIFPDKPKEGIKFHVFSDKISRTTQSYSPLTFYVAFVLVIGTYVRSFLAGQPEKIILTEMPHNEKILDLCEGIKISRYSHNFEGEEKYFYILMDIMRSPDYLKLMTNSSIDQFGQRLKMTEEENKAEEEKEKEKVKEKEKK